MKHILALLSKASPDKRAELLHALISKWCMGCGLTYDECQDGDVECCCGVEMIERSALQCPKCEMMQWTPLEEGG